MPRIEPLSREQLQEFEPVFQMLEQVMGFVPNSVLTMARQPPLLQAALGLFQAAMNPEGRVPSDLKQLVAHVASSAAGCRYCMAHTAHGAERRGVPAGKIEAVWEFEQSALFSDAEKAALRVAAGAARSPGEVTDEEFRALQAYFDDDEILEIIAVIGMFGFLNRWNDTLATELETDPLRFGESHLAHAGWQAGKHKR